MKYKVEIEKTKAGIYILKYQEGKKKAVGEFSNLFKLLLKVGEINQTINFKLINDLKGSDNG